MRISFTLALVFLCNGLFSQTLTLYPPFGNAGLSRTNLANNAPHTTLTTGKQSDGKILLGGAALIRVFSTGEIDSSFGVNGLATKAVFPYVNALAVQNDDRVVCALNDYAEVILKRFTASGQVDSSFNNTGAISIAEAGKNISISKIRLQNDGKILLAGSSFAVDKSSFFIARFLPDGKPDLTFNSTGRLTIDVAGWDNQAYDIAEQNNGQLVVAGAAQNSLVSTSYLYLMRLNPDGSRDNTFNNTGAVSYGTDTKGLLLHLYGDDRILISGTQQSNLLLMRLQAGGAPDSSFGNNGITLEAGLGYSLPKQLHVQADSIFIAGQSSENGVDHWEYAAFSFKEDGTLNSAFNGSGKSFSNTGQNNSSAGGQPLNDGSLLMAGYSDINPYASTARFGADGLFDAGYGLAGIKPLKVNGTDESISSLLQQTDGKLLAIGNSTNSLATFINAVVVRYQPNGGIDSSFGVNGIVNIAEENFSFHSSILQPDGKILLLGDKRGDAPDFLPNMAVIRLNENGSTDDTFGTNGTMLFPSSETSGYGKGIALMTDGRIIVAGKDASNSDIIVAYSLNNDGSIDNGFGTSGKRSFNPGSAENGLGTIAVQSDNKILLAGYLSENNNQSAFFCARLQVNGSTDNTFGNNGVYRTPTSSTAFLELNCMTVMANDKIWLAGHVSNPSGRSSSVRVIRLQANGLIDNSFNGNGSANYYKSLSQDSTFVIPNAIALHPDSSLYIVGAAVNSKGINSQFIIRVKQTGILDSTISTEGSGWYYRNNGGLDAVLNDIIIAADSTVYVGGSEDAIGTNIDMLIAAYKRLPDVIGITYVFTGNGLWTDAANWQNQLLPPASLPNGATILVKPVVNGTAILNVQQNIEAGGRVVISNNARMQVVGNLKLGN